MNPHTIPKSVLLTQRQHLKTTEQLRVTLVDVKIFWRVLPLSSGAQLLLATAATVWPCWGPCQLQPTLCWSLLCGTTSSYGASFRPSCSTSPFTCCWQRQYAYSLSRWSRATVSLREAETYSFVSGIPLSHRTWQSHLVCIRLAE